MAKRSPSARGLAQGNLSRRMPDVVVSPRINDSDTASSLNNAIDEFEKIFADGIGKLKAAVGEDQALVAGEAQQIEEVIEGLNAKVALLETMLTEAEGTLQKQELANQEIENRLNTEIRDLKNAVSQKQEALDGRDAEINDLKSKKDILAEQLTQLELAVQQAKDDSASQGQHAEEVIEGLKAQVTELEAKLKDTEDTLQRKDLAIQEKTDSLNAGITDLQNQVREKQESLNSRDAEITDLKSTRDILAEQVAHLESAIEQNKEEARSQAQQSDEFVEVLHAKITALEVKLRETENTLQGKDVAIHEKENNFSAEIQDLKGAATQKQEALDRLEAEVNDFKAQRDTLAEQVAQLECAIQQTRQEADSQGQHDEEVIEGLKTKIATLETQLAQTEQAVGGIDATIKGPDENRGTPVIDLDNELEPPTNEIKEMYSFFAQSESWSDSQARDIGARVATEPLKIAEENPVTSPFHAEGPTSAVVNLPREFVSREFLDRMIADFSEFTNVIGTIASLIVRDHMRALGESMEEFPQTRLTELVESLSGEIFDYKLRAEFHERFGKV